MLEALKKGGGPTQRMLAILCIEIIHSLNSEGQLSSHSSPAQLYGRLLTDHKPAYPLTSAIALTPSCIVELMSSSSLLCDFQVKAVCSKPGALFHFPIKACNLTTLKALHKLSASSKRRTGLQGAGFAMYEAKYHTDEGKYLIEDTEMASLWFSPESLLVAAADPQIASGTDRSPMGRVQRAARCQCPYKSKHKVSKSRGAGQCIHAQCKQDLFCFLLHPKSLMRRYLHPQVIPSRP
jgi:hypothetical protein